MADLDDREVASESYGGVQYSIIQHLWMSPWGMDCLAVHPDVPDRTLLMRVFPLLEEETFEFACEHYRREVLASYTLDHPNIIHILDLIEEPNRIIVTMPFVEAITLEDFIVEQSPAHPEPCLHILRQLAQTAAALHESKLIFRDLSAKYIRIDNDMHLSVADPGPMLNHSACHRYGMLDDGIANILPAYVRDEQIDQRSDVFHLSVLGYQLLSGSLPSVVQPSFAMSELQQDPNTFLLEQNPRCPLELAELVTKGLEPKASARFSTLEAFINELNSIQTDEIELDSPGTDSGELLQPSVTSHRPNAERTLPHTTEEAPLPKVDLPGLETKPLHKKIHFFFTQILGLGPRGAFIIALLVAAAFGAHSTLSKYEVQNDTVLPPQVYEKAKLGWYIQHLRTSDSRLALAELEKLLAADVPATLFTNTREGVLFYWILSGPESEHGDIKHAKEVLRLRKLLNSEAQIIRIRKR